jgi:hypothetical protein
MSIEMSSEEGQQYVINNKPWGSYSGSEYSTSGYSNISSSPMECSSKSDETSSLCSSNSGSNSGIDMVKLPKPPPSLGRRRQRQVTAQTLEVFEFSDSFPEPISFTCAAQNMSSKQPTPENSCYSNDVNETKDRYDALRNVINDNDTLFVEKSQTTIQQTTNPFAPAPLQSCYNGYMDSGKSNKKPIKHHASKNDKAVFMQSTQNEVCQNEDKYAAISEATQVSNQLEEGGGGCMKWSRSVMGHGQFGWSDQVLNGESC